MIVGDTHGNIGWLQRYIYPMAVAVNASTIIVVGDFGAWEHTRAGVEFFDEVAELAGRSGIPLYWLHGNHDKFSLTLSRYGDQQDDEGFVICRPGLLYIPQGHSWTWSGTTLRAFGGAYSIDKSWRLDQEQYRHTLALGEAQRTGVPLHLVESHAQTLWFPEEQMTDEQMQELLRLDPSAKDIVLSHDKPYSAQPGWDRKDLSECMPNQLRLEWALRLHRPKYWFHGHLHYHYIDPIQAGAFETRVVGLDPDENAAQHGGWRRENTWALLDLSGDTVRARLGREVDVRQGALDVARQKLA